MSDGKCENRRYTHLDTELNLAQKLDLMFWDKLGKRDKEPDLESSHSMVRQSIQSIF